MISSRSSARGGVEASFGLLDMEMIIRHAQGVIKYQELLFDEKVFCEQRLDGAGTEQFGQSGQEMGEMN